jgi:hypothetical protein
LEAWAGAAIASSDAARIPAAAWPARFVNLVREDFMRGPPRLDMDLAQLQSLACLADDDGRYSEAETGFDTSSKMKIGR